MTMALVATYRRESCDRSCVGVTSTIITMVKIMIVSVAGKSGIVVTVATISTRPLYRDKCSPAVYDVLFPFEKYCLQATRLIVSCPACIQLYTCTCCVLATLLHCQNVRQTSLFHLIRKLKITFRYGIRCDDGGRKVIYNHSPSGENRFIEG